MLVLSRHVNQKIVITIPSTGEKITLVLIDVRPDKARIGIQAPRDYPVNREEIQVEIDKGNPPRSNSSPRGPKVAL